MVQAAKIVFDCPFDQQTIAVLKEIRTLRIDVVKRQLAHLEDTRLALHEKKMAQGDDYDAPSREELAGHLREKLAHLEARLNSPDFFADEIEFYVSLLADNQMG